MQTVFLFISNNAYASDLLRTRFIVELAARFHVLAFLAPGALAGGAPYPALSNLTYIERAIQHPKFWILFGKLLRYSMIRKYDFEPVVARNRLKGMRDWRRRALRTLSYALPQCWITNDLFTWLETLLVPRNRAWEELLRRYEPAIILTCSPGFNHFDAEAVVYARKYCAPTAAINFNWDNLHNGGVHFRRTDYLCLWNDHMKGVAVREYGYVPENVFISGPVRFDNHISPQRSLPTREEFLRSKNLDPREKMILLTTITDGNYPEEHLVLADILAARERGVFAGYPNIFVRLHPKEDGRRFASLLASPPRNFHLEAAGKRRATAAGSAVELDEEDIANLTATLRYADVNTNYRSTLSIEAILCDTPVVNICYPDRYARGYSHRHYVPLLESGAVRLVRSPEDLMTALNAHLTDPSLGAVERSRAREQLMPRADGTAYKRLVDMIEICVTIAPRVVL
ncbi:MAG: hypothetical protein Q8R39_03185 [bacterium]|nr:hypothetical protein [bacterium]MDZ4285089.1 hypothetical protein [Patescibacteria group bacterium]